VPRCCGRWFVGLTRLCVRACRSLTARIGTLKDERKGLLETKERFKEEAAAQRQEHHNHR
jgi:hypothetical protein